MPGRFVDVVERQLDLFASEHDDLLEDARHALDRYNAASKDEAEELYGDYVDRIDAARDALLELRDTYARTLAADVVDEYEALFNRLARKRLPSLGLELD